MELAIPRIRAAIIGSGSIGIDLMYKAIRSHYLDLRMVVGRSQNSEGLARARELAIATSADGIEFLAQYSDEIDIIFDATSAQSHQINDPVFRKAKILAIDMTPAKIGAICVPSINLDSMTNKCNVNLVSCGGQAGIPLAYAIAQSFYSLEYIEIASTIASNSAGLATRENINQYILTTEQALRCFTGGTMAKAVLTINPAKPGVDMQTTVFAKGDYESIDKVRASVSQMVAQVQRYVPGYQMVLEPIESKGHLTMSVTVQGSGDYLPAYAGNLDIINCAAIAVAEFHSASWGRTAA